MVEPEVVRSAPSGPLAGHVLDYVRYREQLGAPVRRSELPSSAVVAVMCIESSIHVGSTAVRSLVVGLHERPLVTEHSGLQCGMQIRLKPLAAYTVFGIRMDLLASDAVELPALLGGAGAELVERLGAEPGWAKRRRLIEAAFLARLERGPKPDPAVAWVWSRLVAARGRVGIGGLAREAGRSHRHIVRKFREQIGAPPKTVARVLRFEHASRLVAAGGELAAVATRTGYSDQAHMTRDFRVMAGRTPIQWRASCPAS